MQIIEILLYLEYPMICGNRDSNILTSKKKMVMDDNVVQPTIVKYIEANYAGIQLMSLSRYALGYVVHGSKEIYYGDAHYSISSGDVFYMGVGNHYVENLPDEGHPFEQIVVYYSPELLRRILLQLNVSYGMSISNTHNCDRCRRLNHVSLPATVTLRSFFLHTATYLQEENFMHDHTAENIKMTELIYLIASHSDNCLKSKVLGNIDAMHDNFEQVIHSNIFRDVSIEDLAIMCNRSLTSFKKEFKRRYMETPHRWFIRQRLMQARLLLISTTKSISEIGAECAFSNTSHFIKLFKKEYGQTPAVYRMGHCSDADSHLIAVDSGEAAHADAAFESIAI